MDASIESPPPPPSPHQLAELVQSLDLATQMLKQLPTTAEPTHQQVIFSALHSAHQSLSAFLSSHYPPASPTTAFPAANSYPENSASSSAVGTAAEPMQMIDYDGGDDGGEDEQNSKDSSMDRVEEKMRDFNIQNKRPKRPLSPTSGAMEERLRMEDRLRICSCCR